MAGLVPAIHVFLLPPGKKDVDARDKRGHDGGEADSIRAKIALGPRRKPALPLVLEGKDRALGACYSPSMGSLARASHGRGRCAFAFDGANSSLDWAARRLGQLQEARSSGRCRW